MKLKAFVVAVAAMLVPLEAHAEPTIGQYLEATGPLRAQMMIWLTGVENGLMYASIANEQDGTGKRLYCAPDAYLLTPQQLDQVLRSYLKDSPPSPNMPATLFVLRSLQKTFPCPPAKS